MYEGFVILFSSILITGIIYVFLKTYNNTYYWDNEERKENMDNKKAIAKGTRK